MPQASLMTWLNKPRVISEPQVASVPNTSPEEAEPIQHSAAPLQQNDQPGRERTELDVKAMQLFELPQKPLLDNVELRACTKEDIPHLKHLTGLLLPIPYPDTFFKQIITDELTNRITLLAVWHDDPASKAKHKGRLVGAIRCRLLAHSPVSQPLPKPDDGSMLYLSTLILLSPYRSHGIASHMLQTLTRRAIEEYGVASVGAHVWEANVDALEWYRRRGFCEIGREEGYYRRLEPQGAVVMQRKVSVMDLIGKQG